VICSWNQQHRSAQDYQPNRLGQLRRGDLQNEQDGTPKLAHGF